MKWRPCRRWAATEAISPAKPTTEQKQRYALRQCFLLAIRMARKAQKAGNSRSSEWNHIIRFCKNADEDGNICGSSVLRQS
jgi:hypothetical protein